MTAAANVILGRSSSHFTRVARIFAEELHVPYSLEVVRDLLSTRSLDYGGNPALKIPVLKSDESTWFGALNVCRQLARASTGAARIVWPEDLATALLANAQELITHAMSAEVGLIMRKVAGGDASSADQRKLIESLTQTLSWLENNVTEALHRLPTERDFSYLEVSLFCLVEHLEFRDVLPMNDYPCLRQFADRFGERAAARRTAYRFDV